MILITSWPQTQGTYDAARNSFILIEWSFLFCDIVPRSFKFIS